MINHEDILRVLKEERHLTLQESFDFAKEVSIYLGSENLQDNEIGRNIVIYILDHWSKIPLETHSLWTDLIESCGFYPYLEKEENQLKFKGLSGQIRKAAHLSPFLNGKYFHEEQLAALNIFNSDKNLIVSAPTSFGKSLLIEEIVASKAFKNIIIIQPTLALLDETRRNLKKYRDHYRLIIKTSQEYSEDGNNIFLFTAERVIEYPQFPKIDVLIIDEFYKLSTSRKDDRADTLNVAFYKILKKYNPKFYLLGPNIDSVSSKFMERFNAYFFKTNYSLVVADVVSLYEQYKDKLSKFKTNRKFAEELLFKTLIDLKKEQTLIYCSSPKRTRELSKKFLAYLKTHDKELKKQSLPLVEWIKEHIHAKWSLCECLEYGIGVHDAALPRHVGSSVIHYFNRTNLKYLFCTSTIIEGVNTSAKNVILFDKKRGRTTVDYFDYSNIKGRAGRMMVHYVGRVFNFHPEPKKKSVNIDFPFYDQETNTSKEILIQIDKEDIRDQEDKNYREIQSIPADERELFRKNGVSVVGQKNILDQMIVDLKTRPELVIWNRRPNWEQLIYAINLAVSHIKKPNDSMAFSQKKIAYLVNEYTKKPEIMRLVIGEFKFAIENSKNEKSKEEVLDDAVRTIFQFQRHWLEYTLPKWFHVLNNLQEYACNKLGIKPGNYTYYASSLENDFLNPVLTFLIEMGIPRSAITKIEAVIPEGLELEEDIISFIRKNMDKMNFTEYEADRVRDL